MSYSSIISPSEASSSSHSVRQTWESSNSPVPSIASSTTSAVSGSAPTGIPNIYFNPNISGSFISSNPTSPWAPLSRSVVSSYLERSTFSHESNSSEHSSIANTPTSSALMVCVDESELSISDQSKTTFEEILGENYDFREDSPSPSIGSTASSMWDKSRTCLSRVTSSIAGAFSDRSTDDRKRFDSNVGTGSVTDFEHSPGLQARLVDFLGPSR
ncbi:uncharacterized protein L199_007569 [Kwoniella botswanensis]|uniref:uncharacterized protein n=1 Tax=Kwoniella botswanensis TaxID=1268659 RepID=UPI00315C4C8A